MAINDNFGRICQRVCEEQGWELLPSGVNVTWSDGRHQVVALIGSVTDLGPQRLIMALRINSGLVHGALAVKEDQLVITDTPMLEDAGPGEIKASIRYLARTADFYERTLFGADDF